MYNIDQCQKCGTCCRKGPPGLHIQDRDLYLSGILRKNHLLTLRKGESVFDNVQDRIKILSEEMIRIRSREGEKTCLFLEEGSNYCSIYSHRPAECRAMKCWDTREIKHVYQMPGLRRSDLVPEDCALFEILSEHESRCPLETVRELVREFQKSEDKSLLDKLAEFLDMDRRLRKSLQEKTAAESASLDFVLGRSLDRVLPAWGLEVKPKERGYCFFKKHIV